MFTMICKTCPCTAASVDQAGAEQWVQVHKDSYGITEAQPTPHDASYSEDAAPVEDAAPPVA